MIDKTRKYFLWCKMAYATRWFWLCTWIAYER